MLNFSSSILASVGPSSTVKDLPSSSMTPIRSSTSYILMPTPFKPAPPPPDTRRKTPIQLMSTRTERRNTILLSSSVDNPATASERSKDGADECGSEIVRKFYEGINGHDLESVEELIAEKCVYEDLIFPRPFTGRKAILEFFRKFNDAISTDLRFVIDDISTEDSSAVGVTWHLEWKGKPFPFSKGCSFYRLEVINGRRQIIYGRDSVEPAIKPGEAALNIIRGVVWLLERFPRLEDQL